MAIDTFSYEDYIRYLDVSRETYDRLDIFVTLLKKWHNHINLVSTSTLKNVWVRHVIDSAQLNDYVPKGELLLDIGSGGGFPGLVLGILGVKNITLVESDTRKAAFLQEAARATGTALTIKKERIENTEIGKYGIISARAFASLTTLLNVLGSGLTSCHKLLLLKGKNWELEVMQARESWNFDYSVKPSISDPQGVILSLIHLQKIRSIV